MSASRARVLLIVDDEVALVEIIAARFRGRGFEVREAATGEEALRVLRAEAVDGLLVDFWLPDVRGDVLLSAAIAIQPRLLGRAVFMTGDLSDIVPNALSDFQAPIVLKPFLLAELQRVVADTMSAANPSSRRSTQ